MSSQFDDYLLKICVYLNIPCIHGNLRNLAEIDSNPFKVKEIFKASGFPISPSSKYIKIKEELSVCLSKLILKNPTVEKWLFMVQRPKLEKLSLGFFDLSDFIHIKNLVNNPQINMEKKANTLLQLLTDVTKI